MEKSIAYCELRRLVEKYITHDLKKKELLEILATEQYMPPVRGVIDDIYETSRQISEEDKSLISELMHFFG